MQEEQAPCLGYFMAVANALSLNPRLADILWQALADCRMTSLRTFKEEWRNL